MILIVFLVGFIKIDRLGVGAQVAADQIWVFSDQLGRSVNTVLRKRNLQCDHIDDGGIAELLRLRFSGFGHHGELHDAFLQRHHALEGAADDAQVDVLERVDADFLQADFKGKLGRRAGDMIAADFSFEIFGLF